MSAYLLNVFVDKDANKCVGGTCFGIGSWCAVEVKWCYV